LSAPHWHGAHFVGRVKHSQPALDSQPLVQLFSNFGVALVPAVDDCEPQVRQTAQR
jgi:hypothetical protein